MNNGLFQWLRRPTGFVGYPPQGGFTDLCPITIGYLCHRFPKRQFGPPSAQGRLQFWRVFPWQQAQYLIQRGKNLSSEALVALMDWAAAKHQVPQFVLTISPENAPSLRMAERFGFVKVGSHVDPEDGLEYIFVRNATTY